MARKRQHRRRLLVLVLMLVAGGLVVLDLMRDPHGGGPGVGQSAATQVAATGSAVQATATATPTAAASFPVAGPGTFTVAKTQGALLGLAGSLRTFKVAVEKGATVDAQAFADQIDTILGDPRSWIAGNDVRFQRVAASAKTASFTIYLATAGTSEKMCRADGLFTDKYTSCRLSSGKVVINLTRWLTAIPDYGAPLDVYQAYAINHEVGHQLGHGHEGCPSPGRLAPVMQQQTLGLHECLANAWPYVDGQRYDGPPIP